MDNELRVQLKAAREKLKDILAQAKTLRGELETNTTLTDEERKAKGLQYDKLLGQGDALKLQIMGTEHHEELADWAHSSDGGSIVRKSLGSQTDGDDPDAEKGFDPKNPWRNAGVFEGMPLHKAGIKCAPSGWEATDQAGEMWLACLKSNQYKDLLNFYLRNGWKANFNQMLASKGEAAMKVLQEGQDSAGGLWVVPDIRSELVKKEATMATIRPNAFAFTIGSDRVSFPKVVYTTDDKYTSGVRFAWTAEAPSSDISESTNPVAGRTNIDVFTATAAIILTRANMEDAQFDLLGFVGQLISEAFILGENDVFCTGNGAGQPEGFLSHANVSVAHASAGMMILSGANDALAWGNSTTGIIGTEAALPPQYEANAKWYGNKKTYAAIASLNVGTANWPQWLPGDQYPNVANGMQPRLLGYPIVKDQFMPDVGNAAYPLAFGDMTGYWIADRVGITVEVLREIKALRDEVVVYARKRVGGKLVHDWRMKVCKSEAA